jgi:UDP-N-acetyl-2-amino-2-deoxyglucuronate dehydrogenase
MSDTLGVVLCGTGEIASTHAAAIAATAGARLVGIAGSEPGRTRTLAVRFGVQAFDGLPEALARKDVGAVVIASATERHLDHLRLAIDAGKHALVEKPLAIDVAAASRVIAAATATGLIVAGVFQRRFLPIVEELRAAAAAGSLGRPIGATATLAWRRDARYFQESPWRGERARAGGGVTMMQGIHTIDLMRYVLGEVADVKAATTNVRKFARVEDTAAFVLRFENGALAGLFATTAARKRMPARIVLHFEAGSVEIVGEEVGADTRKPAARGMLASLRNLTARWRKRPDLRAPLFARLHDDFVTAVRDGRQARCPGEDALESVRVVQSLYASAAGLPSATHRESEKA